jgi:uncharacterized protein YyaL (SSP411 family)
VAGRLADAASPYLRSHAGNPVDWWPWSEDAFAEAARRDVPVMVSIGYATCHWCHVMARESFEDPVTATELNEGFVAIKVDREEHPEVDAAYMAAASAFTQSLGWPLTVFATPDGVPFFAGTYFPPRPVGQVPAFRQVLGAVRTAWTERRDEVDATAAALRDALLAQPPEPSGTLPALADLDGVVERIAGLEDPEFGGFGRAPKFPQAPVLAFLADRGTPAARDLADRTMRTMAASSLRDPVEGGFFRYAVQRDWTEPHYERMLSDNAQLLRIAATLGHAETAAGIASFLLEVLRLPSGAFASAQDSESDLDGVRSEGGYYALDAAERGRYPRPALDAKVLTGLNGFAIGALAEAGVRFDRTDWVEGARAAADAVLAAHRTAEGLARASLDGVLSEARATLEDYGGLAGGLLRLALATGEVSHAVVARELIEACAHGGDVRSPAGPDPVLASRGLVPPDEASDGAVPSGRAALADAALLLGELTGDDAHRRIAEAALRPALDAAVAQPTAFGAALTVAVRLARPVEQLVVVAPDGGGLVDRARAWDRTGVLAIVRPAQAAAFADAGFGLFEARDAIGGLATAYLCEHFVCALPATSVDDLERRLAG